MLGGKFNLKEWALLGRCSKIHLFIYLTNAELDTNLMLVPFLHNVMQ